MLFTGFNKMFVRFSEDSIQLFNWSIASGFTLGKQLQVSGAPPSVELEDTVTVIKEQYIYQCYYSDDYR